MHWSEVFTNVLTGIGVLSAGVAALLALPRFSKILERRHKDETLIRLYQRVVYRMYREVEASSEGITYSLPKDVEQLTNLLVTQFPQIGSRESADRLMDDLMEDGYFKTVVVGKTVIETHKWDPDDRSKPVSPDIENLPPE